jgi:hypothetical protein
VQNTGNLSPKDCVFWLAGSCKNGENCPFQHPPKKPILKNILKYQTSTKEKPNVEVGISYTTPTLPGLPVLPQNGKCRILKDNLVIYFIPFFKPIDGNVYFKKIILFRFYKGEYKLVFSYTKQGFHFTTAAATHDYLVCSRLPYDVAILKMMEEAKKMRKQNEFLKKKDERQTKQISREKAKNRVLSDKLARKPVSSLRIDARIKIEQNNIGIQRIDQFQYQRLNQLQFRIMDNFRTADPIDLFVFDPVIKTLIHVLEYHKPADHVNLEGRVLGLWDQKTGLYHSFQIKMITNDVPKYDLDEPLQPKQLCDVF